MDGLTLEYGDDWLSRNIGRKLLFFAVYNPDRAQMLRKIIIEIINCVRWWYFVVEWQVWRRETILPPKCNALSFNTR